MSRTFLSNWRGRSALWLTSLLAGVFLVCATAGAATLSATPSSFAGAVTSAQAGDTVLLASGSYGTWAGTNKAITIKADTGASPTMTLGFSTGDANFTLDGIRGLSGNIDNDVHDVTIRNSTTTSTIEITGDRSGPVVFDNVHFDAHVSDCANGCLPALWIGPGGTAHDTRVVVKNSLFTHSPGDGVQAGSAFTVTDSEFNVTNNGACEPCHTDSIQLYGGQASDGTGSTILRNYIHDGGTDSDGIAQFDGGGNNDIEDNVIAREQLFAMDLGNDTGSKVIHNTIVVANGRTGIDMTSKQKPGSQGAVIKDNVVPSTAFVGGSCNCTAVPSAYTNNLIPGASSPNVSGSPTFVGGASPTTYAGFALAAGSPGKGRASDGLDVGARFGASSPPPADTTPPDTTIATGPSDPTTSTSASFAFSSNESGSTFACKLDAGAYAACSSPKAYSALSIGSHTFSVRATDAAGNVDASPATQTWSIGASADTTAPDTMITSGPANPTTETTSSSGFDSTESGSTFACKLDAGAYAACSSPSASSGLSMGSHTFSVRATDAAGNTDASPATETWMIQSAPPADHQPVAAYVYSPTTPAAGQAVTFDASSATCDDAPCTYSWADDGSDGPAGTQWPLGSGKTMTFTFQGTGTKSVRLVITDADGDTGTIMKAITVVATAPPADTTAPNTTIDSGPTATTNDNTPTFTFSSSEGGSTMQCRVDSGSWASCASPWTTSVLSDGAHSVSVRATDAAGNTDASPATRSFTVATTTTSQNLLGSSVVQSEIDGGAAGHAEAFQATATGSGAAVALSIYLGTGNTATTLVAGLYSDVNGHPGTLMSKGTRSAPTAAAWNQVTIPATSLASGQKYWIALMGTGGGLKYRDAVSGSNCHSESSLSQSLTTLPTAWQTGASWASCPLSGYATS